MFCRLWSPQQQQPHNAQRTEQCLLSESCKAMNRKTLCRQATICIQPSCCSTYQLNRFHSEIFVSAWQDSSISNIYRRFCWMQRRTIFSKVCPNNITCYIRSIAYILPSYNNNFSCSIKFRIINPLSVLCSTWLIIFVWNIIYEIKFYNWKICL